MSNSDALCVYIIDRSGSMRGKEVASADGFNTFVEEQTTVEGTAYISVVLFGSSVTVPVDPVSRSPFVAWKAQDMPKMTVPHHHNVAEHRLPLQIGGMTALRDAVMTGILGAEAWLANNDWFDGHVVVSTITDGGENQSSQFQPSDLRAKIEQKQAAGWIFVFQGDESNGAWLQAGDMHIDPNTVFAVDLATADGTLHAYASNSVGVTSLRTTGNYSQT